MKCSSEADYQKKDNIFIPNTDEEKKHIPYDEHLYVIPIDIKEKIENKIITENDFLAEGLLDKKIGTYFKYNFLNNIQLKPIDAKIDFSEEFPNINLTDKS